MIIPTNLLSLFCICENMNHRAYIVGGAVRDHINNITPKDFDIVTSMDLVELGIILEQNGWDVKHTGSTCDILNISKVYPYMINEKYCHYYDNMTIRYEIVGMRSNTSSKTLEDDANCRDFTINSVYYDPLKNELIDPTGFGISDIESKILRFVGNGIDRITEDPIRIWRFFRFSESGYVPCKKDSKLVKKMFTEQFHTFNPSRVLSEMLKYHKNIY